MTACILLAWLKLIALDGGLAGAEPKTPRYRLLPAWCAADAAGPSSAAAWPWSGEIVTA